MVSLLISLLPILLLQAPPSQRKRGFFMLRWQRKTHSVFQVYL